MAIVLDGTTGITTPDLTDTSLTAGRVVYAGTSGNLTGSASLVFDGTNLGVLAGSVTTPASKLHVVGPVRSSNSAGTLFSSLASDGVYASGTDLYLFAPTGYSNIFYANNVERMRLPVAGGLKTSTTISVGNATPSTSGAGITFPASQDASSDANTLDDYEEGSFTPTVTFASGSGATFNNRSAQYTKIGRIVFVQYNVHFSGLGTSSGALTLGGLPFATVNDSYMGRFTGAAFLDRMTNGFPFGVGQNATTFAIQSIPNGSGSSSELTAANLNATTYLTVNFYYIIS